MKMCASKADTAPDPDISRRCEFMHEEFDVQDFEHLVVTARV